MRSFLRRLLFETEVSGRTAAGRAGRQSGSPDGAAEERAQPVTISGRRQIWKKERNFF